ncbi:hypothetical protein [Yinghuangia aomiensis]|uniref:hypothetical protein n=1 Tax=Yinghuangia aomiensis TaxID=676205 RepID=UPI0031E78560
MAHTEHGGHRQFLDAAARALISEDDIWQVETLAGGSTLVARTDDGDEGVVALIEVGLLDATVTVDDVLRVEALAAEAGATALDGRPATFICARREPARDAIQAAFLRNMRILNVRPIGANTWGHDEAVLSRQQFTQPPDAPALSEQQWQVIHDGGGNAVFHDRRWIPIATFSGLRAELAWREATEVSSAGSAWGSWCFEMPAGTVMTVPEQPPIPVTSVTLRFHKEMCRLQATSEESAFIALATDWLWG